MSEALRRLCAHVLETQLRTAQALGRDGAAARASPAGLTQEMSVRSDRSPFYA